MTYDSPFDFEEERIPSRKERRASNKSNLSFGARLFLFCFGRERAGRKLFYLFALGLIVAFLWNMVGGFVYGLANVLIPLIGLALVGTFVLILAARSSGDE